MTSVEELFGALDRIEPGGTIFMADGHYKLPRVMVLQDKKGLTIRSAAGDPAKVALSGQGWDSNAMGDDILHIGRCEGVTIADLTFADCHSYGVKVEAENAPQDIHIYNCRFRDIGVRAIKGSAGQDPNVRAVKGSVRYCHFENTKTPPADWLDGGDYIAAIDMMALEEWVFSDNVFRNIRGRNGGGRAAIFIWVRSQRLVAERNLIVNCDRGVAFGNPGHSTANRAGERRLYVRDGIIRNNFIAGGPDCGIELWYADGIEVYNNTIWRPERNWSRGIRVGTGTARTEIVNNLVHGEIRLEGGEASVRNNLAGRLDDYFADPALGDLRLTSAAVGAVDQGVSLAEVTDDIRGRPRSGSIDIGAWEFDDARHSTIVPVSKLETDRTLQADTTILLGERTATIKRIDSLPYVESEFTRRFRFDSFDNPKLKKLRERYELDAVVAPGRDEFERQVLLLDWVHHRFKKFGRPSSEAKGALEILQAIDEGHTFFCAHYAHVFVSAAASLGWIDRELALRRHQDPPQGGSSEHSTTEIWSNRYRKWVMMDPTAHMYIEKEGIPLSAYEIRQEWFYRQGRDLIFVIGKERKRYRKSDLPIFLGRFTHFGDLTVPADELDKYGFIGYIPNTDLMDAGLDYGQMFIVKDQLCEGTRWHQRTVPSNPAVDPYFPVNQGGRMFHNNFWPYVEMDRTTGRWVERENMLPTRESLYKMTDGDWLYENLKDDLALQMYVFVQGYTRDIAVEAVGQLARRLGLPPAQSASQSEHLRTYVRHVLDKYSLTATQYILEKTREFTARHGKRLLVVLFDPGRVLPQLVKGRARYDQETVDFLQENGFAYFDMNVAHAEDFKCFRLDYQQYRRRYFIGHYNPSGNHFFAFAIKDTVVNWLDPKPITYRPGQDSLIQFKDYLSP